MTMLCIYVLALAHIKMPFWLCIPHQVGSVCHLVQSDEPGIHTCSVDSLRRSVHLGLLNQIIGVRDLGVTHSLRFRSLLKRNVTGCNIFSASVRFMLQNVFHSYYCSSNWQEQCFYHLRTIQQLGYIVFCHNIVNEGVGSFEASYCWAGNEATSCALCWVIVYKCM